ncbi:MAG: hypothetical protein MN733_37825 [Nitrososphaera sp.]|nr:hypothetical protein [Nitrososphaera sp.]
MIYDFYDRDHANNYLAGTIIRFEGRPTYVQNVDYVGPRSRKLLLIHSPLRSVKTLQNKLEDFDLRPWKLGMYNFRIDGMIAEAAWMQRYPARRWKVGLDHASICVIPVRKAEDNIIFDIIRRGNQRATQWSYNEDMANMLEQIYPTLHEALLIIGRCTRRSVAFSPNFAVTGTKKLMYRHNDEPVGRIEDGRPVLSNEYAQLPDMLEEEFR